MEKTLNIYNHFVTISITLGDYHMLNETDKKLFFSLVDEIQNKYEHHRDVAINIVMKAWDECYDLSYIKIYDRAHDLAKFVSKCLWVCASYAGNKLFDGPKYNANLPVDE